METQATSQSQQLTLSVIPALSYAIKVINQALRGEIRGLVEFNWEGSRLSAKTKSAEILASVMAHIVATDKRYSKVKLIVNVITYKPKTALEKFKEMAEIATLLGVSQSLINKTERTIRYHKTIVRCIGVKSNTTADDALLGLFRPLKPTKHNNDVLTIIVNVVDEITQFPSRSSLEKALQSMGGAEIILNFKMSNPWTLAHFWTKENSDDLPPIQRLLLKKGEQFREIIYNPTHRRYVHRINHKLNPFLSQSEHDLLDNLKGQDEHLWLVASLGMPGVQESSIYGHLLDKVRPWSDNILFELGKENVWFRGGLDWGESELSATTAVFDCFPTTATKRWKAMLDCYYHSNRTGNKHLDTDMLIKNCVAFFVRCYRKHRKNFQVRVDYASAGIIQLLKAELSKYAERSVIEFLPCVKYAVVDRVATRKYLMGIGGYLVNRERLTKAIVQKEAIWMGDVPLGFTDIHSKYDIDLLSGVAERCKDHMRELELAEWEPKLNKDGLQEPVNENDHTLDADDYALHSDLPKFNDKIQNQIVAQKPIGEPL